MRNGSCSSRPRFWAPGAAADAGVEAAKVPARNWLAGAGKAMIATRTARVKTLARIPGTPLDMRLHLAAFLSGGLGGRSGTRREAVVHMGFRDRHRVSHPQSGWDRSVVDQLLVRIVRLVGHHLGDRLAALHFLDRGVIGVGGRAVQHPAFAERLGHLVAEGGVVFAAQETIYLHGWCYDAMS